MTRPTAIGLALLCCAGAGAAGQAPPERYDVILRGGTLIDGTGAPPYRGDVAVNGGFIARVGDLRGADAAEIVDASGLYVTPGFVNIHSHAQAEALPTAENVITQGITTEILNPDGGGSIDPGAQLSALEAAGLAVNVGAYIGLNSIWSDVVGASDRRPAADDIDRMRAMVVAGLEGGAWGVSAGLDYKPAYYATTEEVVAVVSAAGPWRTNFTNHDRLTPEARYSSRAGVSETLLIGRRARLLPVATHMKIQGHEQGSAAPVLELFGDASHPETYAAADVYPYLAGQSGLGALIIPGWAQNGGREEMLSRFRDPAQRARIAAEAEEAMTLRFGGPQGVYLPATGQELTDVMKELGVGAGEAVIRLLEKENMGAILRFGAEADLERLLKHPSTSIACDCGATTATRTHPRNYGTYPRVLGRYVRERGVLTWAEAIRKMTLLPASTIGMIDRGTLAPGMAADIVAFDPASVIDHATYEQPASRSAGVRHVFVNGRAVLRDGGATGTRAGRILRRTRHMPSRPTGPAAAAMSVRDAPVMGASQQVRLSVDLRQRVSDRFARGHVRLRTAEGRTVFESAAHGIIQAASGWTSVTGMARVNLAGLDLPGTERAFSLTIDEAGGAGTAVLTIDGVPPLTLRYRR